MNAYQFVVKMKDLASSELQSIARSAGVADRKVEDINRTSGRLGNTFKSLKRLAAGAFTVIALTTFTNKVIDARAEYEKFQAVLTNSFQSADVGQGALNMLTDFASQTPFQLNELTGSFVKLVNRGINPTKQELTNMGDLAASQGKSFDQLTEALLDAGTGEFERLKEFGIKGSKAGDKVTLSFKNHKEVVDANAEAIKNALLGYGKMIGVAGSMEAISKTLGGRISNLKDRWNMFLVAVGGQSGGVFSGVISMLSAGLGVLTTYLPDISAWFHALWSYIEPVGVALWNFVKAAFGFEGAGDIMSSFGETMNSVLVIVNYLSTGLTWLIDLLTPISDYVVGAAVAWYTWNSALAIFNALMAVNPITWIILGIASLIALIGMVVKYTDGWGKSWEATVNGSKFLWQSFTSSAESVFLKVVNNIMIGINKIKAGWYEFKNAVGMGDSAKNDAMLRQIALDTELRKQQIAEANKKSNDAFQKAKKEFSNFGISLDTAAIKKDFDSIKDKFKNVGQSNTGDNAYTDYLGNKDNGDPTADPAGGNPNAGAQTIVSGGTRRTEINITIQKLQDDTKIFVSSAEEGISSLGENIQETLLRAINSINQMQTN